MEVTAHSIIIARMTVMHCVVLAALIGAGCSGSKVTTRSSAELARYQIRSIVLAPFTSIATPQVRDQGDPFLSTPQSVARSDMSMAVPSSAEFPPRETVTVPGYATEKVTHLFWKRLQARGGLHILPPSDAAKVSPAGEEKAKATPEKAAVILAKRLKVDAALIGQVSVFQERVGSRLGASPPASVGFEVKVVAADGQVLWVGNYYERQRPMIEDFMGFLRRWGAFVTADELARYGVDEVLKEFPFGGGGEK